MDLVHCFSDFIQPLIRSEPLMNQAVIQIWTTCSFTHHRIELLIVFSFLPSCPFLHFFRLSLSMILRHAFEYVISFSFFFILHSMDPTTYFYFLPKRGFFYIKPKRTYKNRAFLKSNEREGEKKGRKKWTQPNRKEKQRKRRQTEGKNSSVPLLLK